MIAGPIWLGDNSSITKRVIEHLHGGSTELNEAGQCAYYGRAGGCLFTGNEDGIKHCAQDVLYSMQHIGYRIPPQASGEDHHQPCRLAHRRSRKLTLIISSSTAARPTYSVLWFTITFAG